MGGKGEELVKVVIEVLSADVQEYLSYDLKEEQESTR